MVKASYLMVFFVILNMRCIEVKKTLWNHNAESSKVYFSKIYLYPFYSYIYDHSKPDLILTDSTLHYQGFIFFSNGIFRKISIDSRRFSADSINNDLDEFKKFKSTWGVYEIRDDSIDIMGWDASQGYPVYEQVGIIKNKGEMVVLKSRCYSCGKLAYGHSWKTNTTNYKYTPMIIKADSTTEFIKPHNSKMK